MTCFPSPSSCALHKAIRLAVRTWMTEVKNEATFLSRRTCIGTHIGRRPRFGVRGVEPGPSDENRSAKSRRARCAKSRGAHGGTAQRRQAGQSGSTFTARFSHAFRLYHAVVRSLQIIGSSYAGHPCEVGTTES